MLFSKARTILVAGTAAVAATMIAVSGASAVSVTPQEVAPQAAVDALLVNGVNEPTLKVGYYIPTNHGLRSENAKYGAIMLANGNFSIINLRTKKVIWSTKTAGNPAATMHLLKDGNLVIRSAKNKSVIWETKTAVEKGEKGAETTRLTIENDGDLCLYRGDVEIWHSETSDGTHQED